MALIGILVKLFIIHAPRWVTAAVYLLMGWLALIAVPEMLHAVPVGALVWLVLGCLSHFIVIAAFVAPHAVAT